MFDIYFGRLLNVSISQRYVISAFMTDWRLIPWVLLLWPDFPATAAVGCIASIKRLDIWIARSPFMALCCCGARIEAVTKVIYRISRQLRPGIPNALISRCHHWHTAYHDAGSHFDNPRSSTCKYWWFKEGHRCPAYVVIQFSIVHQVLSFRVTRMTL